MPAGFGSGNKPPALTRALRGVGRASETGLIAAHDATAVDLKRREGRFPWGLRARSRSSPSRNGRSTSSTCRRPPLAAEPVGRAPERALSRRARELPPQPAAVSAQPRISGPAAASSSRSIESRNAPIRAAAFQTLATLAFLALPVHYLAPSASRSRSSSPYRSPVCSGSSAHFSAAIVLAFATVLIGVCFLPIRWSGRAAIIAAIAVACAIARPGMASSVIPDGVWAIVASMFMFRMMIYLYELKHARKPETLVDTLSYFFLLPNYCFMHFPVVDYRTMQRGYFADDVHAMQQRGLDMMFRGTIHLLCYRLVYHELLIPASKVHDPLSLAAYLVCNYLLYLQVSGQFHMAAGMLHLFGFQLPQTHHHYLLATSFTDYWRRINIYWKDFMVRLFFNPVVFRLKRWPQPLALAHRDRDRLPGHVVPACLPVVLAARELGLHGSRRPLLGHPRGPGSGQRPARRASKPIAQAGPGRALGRFAILRSGP